MAELTVNNTNFRKRYDFDGTALPTDWTIAQLGTNQSVNVANSIMSIVAGTDASQKTIVRCTQPIRPRFYVRFIVSLSQRIANQNTYLEITNAAGDTYARYDLNGTSATSGQGVTANKGTANSPVSATIPTTASYASLTIYADTTDVVFSSSASNGNAAQSGIIAFDRLVFDPNEDYYVQVRVTNGATPPASSTTVNVDAVVIQDMTSVRVDVVRGDGVAAVNNAIPVNVQSAPTTTVQPTISTSFGFGTLHHAISAATTNATSVKTSVGVIGSIELTNNTASWRYFKLYNKASAPTVGTDTPVKTVGVPPNTTLSLNFGHAGLRLTTGIAYALTTGIAVADTAAVGLNEMAVNISYT